MESNLQEGFIPPLLPRIRGVCYCIHVASVSQITESLDSIFESEKRTLDTTATIDKDIDSFPYHLIHNWVRPHCHLVSVSDTKPTDCFLFQAF